MAQETAFGHEPAPGHGVQGWGYSYPPLIISGGVLALALACLFYLVYGNAFAAVIAVGIAVPMTLGGAAWWSNEAIGEGEGLCFAAMGWFVAAEAMFFMAAFAIYWYLRLSADSWPPAGTPEMPAMLPLAMTAVLVGSSLTILRAERRLRTGDVAGFVKWLFATIVLGASFLGMTVYEWSYLVGEGFTIASNIFGTMFYAITGLHGSHVLVGLGIFLAAVVPALGGRVGMRYVQAAALYWHFVDIVWLFVVSQVHLWR